MPVSREQIVSHARAYIGTPFKKYGRSIVTGVDCVGEIIGVSNATGYTGNYDFRDYAFPPNRAVLMAELSKHFDPKPLSRLADGDVVAIAYANQAIHAGIAANNDGRLTVIHSSGIIGRVVEHELDDSVRIVRAWEFRGLES